MSIPSLNCPPRSPRWSRSTARSVCWTPYRGTVLGPATLQPTDKAEELTALDETGRGVQLAQADDGPELVLYQGIQVDARPCVLAFHCCMPHNLQSSAGAREFL